MMVSKTNANHANSGNAGLGNAGLGGRSRSNSNDSTGETSSQSNNNIRVAVRARPLACFEKQQRCNVSMEGRTISIMDPAFFDVDQISGCSLEQLANEGRADQTAWEKQFAFDYAYWSSGESNYTSQKQIFQELGHDVITNAMSGYNCSVIAYGQTGSGKTYTMMGDDAGDSDSDTNAGLIPRICNKLFDHMKQPVALPDTPDLRTKVVQMVVSYAEVYNEQVSSHFKEYTELGA
jgi:hypothetical protein